MSSCTHPHFDRAALITIDTQMDFVDGGSFPIAGTTQALPNMQKLLQAFRQRGLPIVHIVRLYDPEGSNAELCRRESLQQGLSLVAPGSDGAELPPELYPAPGLRLDAGLLLSGEVQQLGPGEAVIYKSRWGAFYKTPLEEHLHGLGADSLVFCGCNYPNCPRASIYQASERDFRIALATDALSGLYEQGLSEMQNIGVHLMTSQEIIQALHMP